MKKITPKIIVEVSETTKKKFKLKCLVNGKSMTTMVRGWVKEYIEK